MANTMVSSRLTVDEILAAAQSDVEAALSRVGQNSGAQFAEWEQAGGDPIRFFAVEARLSARNTGCD
ncbi:hypothetical protein [Baekduia sp. Peel2402]|uniref:hypothetical protein n=1 Tax=Baekduia sp. Peel2402 TaxID=3458296 RepID=UPI00403E7CF3